MTVADASSWADLPLRERKMLKTRRLLIVESQRLFRSQGYRGTTLVDVAEAAEVTVQTVLRYFSSKEELALALERQTLERLRLALQERPAGVSALDTWLDFVAGVVSQWETDPLLIDYLVFLQSDPTLIAHGLEILERNEELLATNLADELGVDAASDPLPWAVAAVAMHGFKRLHRQWMADEDSVDLIRGLTVVGDLARELMRSQRPPTVQISATPGARVARRR